MTQDRLGVYLPVEHIDNPKYVSHCLPVPDLAMLTRARGYAEKEGDARSFHPKV